MLNIIYSSLFIWSLASAQSPQIGNTCTPGKDQYGCQSTNFITCDATTSRWILQNTCSGPCIGDSAFVSQCFLNSQSEPTSSVTSLTTRTSETAQPTDSSSSSSNQSAGNANSDSPISTVVLSIIVACAFLALVIFLIFFRKYFFKSFNWRRNESQENLVETPAGVLQKLYVVVKPYRAAQHDEVELASGDQIELYLLYNDGWAKGFNITTGVTGLIPVTHLEAVPVDGGRSSFGSNARNSIVLSQNNRRPSVIIV